MNQLNYFLGVFVFLLVLNVNAQDVCKPIGWATQNGGVTGGGNATPVVATNYNELKAAVTNKNIAVVHISGTIIFPANGKINVQDQSNKTIFGLPGSKLISTDLSSSGSGIFYVKRMENLILQNIYFEGPGAYDTDGNDNLTVDDCRNVWVDHCEFHDGMDGNFDIKNKADFISVTWCTFSYEKAPIPDGSGGSDDHRYTNLIGSSDGATADDGKLRVTFQYCWWGEGCKERMPRIRFGKVHLVNNLFSSSVANNCIRAGYKADVLVENNVFVNQKVPIDLFNGDYTAVKGINNSGASNISKGTVFTPPYQLSVGLVNTVETQVKQCAGAKLQEQNGCSSCGGGSSIKQKPIINILSPSVGQVFTTVPTNVVLSVAVTDTDGTVSKVEFIRNGNVMSTLTKSPFTYTMQNVVEGDYTVTVRATDNDNQMAEAAITFSVKTALPPTEPATLTKRGAGSSSQVVVLGDELTPYYYEWVNATSVEATGFPAGINIVMDNLNKQIHVSGSPTEVGVFEFEITTVGASQNVSKKGRIEVQALITSLNKLGDEEFVYPIPTGREVFFTKKTKYILQSMGGVLLLEGESDRLDLQELLPGVYILLTAEGVQKIIKE